MTGSRTKVAVSGGASCDRETAQLAYDVGKELAACGAVMLCGGGGGVMERAAAGAKDGGGLTVGILPGRSAAESPPSRQIEVALFTGMGQARNQILVISADVVIAVGGGWGTLSEVALALKQGIPVVSLNSWGDELTTARDTKGICGVSSAKEAVEMALRLAAARKGKE